jgi:CheY-like chemotaxis protein
MQTATTRTATASQPADRVRILLAVGDVTARLTLDAVLRKSGYAVDSAASSAEAMEKIESQQYALVLCNFATESEESSRNVLKLAQSQEYRPATAYLTASPDDPVAGGDAERLLIEPVEVPDLLTHIADLIGNRAVGRARRAARRG